MGRLGPKHIIYEIRLKSKQLVGMVAHLCKEALTQRHEVS